MASYKLTIKSPICKITTESASGLFIEKLLTEKALLPELMLFRQAVSMKRSQTQLNDGVRVLVMTNLDHPKTQWRVLRQG